LTKNSKVLQKLKSSTKTQKSYLNSKVLPKLISLTEIKFLAEIQNSY
ncbi:3056_t:CDS:1, partial [Racocetra fulgida]